MQNVLFIVIGLGVLVLIGWLARGFFTAEEIALWIRVVVGVVAVAGVGLLAIVIRDRMRQAKSEDFKEVDK
jgi:hypothetical protein